MFLIIKQKLIKKFYISGGKRAIKTRDIARNWYTDGNKIKKKIIFLNFILK